MPPEPPANEPFSPDIWRAVATVLGETPVEIERTRWYVALCELGDRRVWVKRPREVQERPWDPSDPDMTWRIRREWAGLQLLEGHAPRLLASDLEAGWLVLEDLSPSKTLVEPVLEGSAAEATAAFEAWGRGLADMHRRSFGRRAEHDALREASGGWAPSDVDWLLGKLQLLLDVVELDEPPALDAILQREPRADDVLIHGDPCPDNVLLMGDHARLIDFERAAWSTGALDVVALRMSQPTCWCAATVPLDLIERVEEAYRLARMDQVTRWTDPVAFRDDLVWSAAHRLVVDLCIWGAKALEEDRKWGIAHIRPRLLTRLAAFLAIGEHHALAPWAARLRAEFVNRWGEQQLAPFPAFSPAGVAR